jgi:exodeoxyribonuclease-3
MSDTHEEDTVRAGLSESEMRDRVIRLAFGGEQTSWPGTSTPWLRERSWTSAVVLLTGRKIRWHTIQLMLDASYVDAYRLVHPPQQDPGFTFPTWDPHVRLDFVFMPAAWTGRLKDCRVVSGTPPLESASDHLPLLAELDEA